MRPGEAVAEDFRRVGVAAIVAGLVGGFLEDRVPGAAAIAAALLGVVANLAGYAIHRREENRP